ncbi:TadE family type IV pilus minor pilin [Acidipropionibacterium jensenii]|uniref:Pilus assembly protein TadE n=1 Tax=Acidipropionibacterium jensenii TaxID=1749 RepID=A0A3Q9UKS6_9ACTN|nr:TadE family type IV pilus minor pilin [Acidipropionibacterium jensenii]AZZ38667.1 hypothetical protein C0Z10_01675 [Acidipropionibacterium jensenii]AZZ41183.1 hypothetical protein C0Z11_01535 [Acidipropionibacterium jensenii]MDN5978155.1 hypothetical protein [Acidipropionibacterium jensenii]MDN5995624.1 hypothetical protein [Acidipropionibacterium jensenii]MDN6426092.1 hypothetical protein [Acidipropionibacterium jensenii]
MVTAELAVSILAAAVLLSLAAWTVGLVGTYNTCRSSAAEIARQLARGDSAAAQRARDRVPQGATVATRDSEGWVTITVTVRRSLGSVGPVTLVGRVTTPYEPGVQR